MAVQDYYFALQNLSNSDKIFGYYSGSAKFDYNFDHRTGSNNLGTYEILLNSGSLGSGGGTNEYQTDRIYLDDKTLNSGESIISYLTKLDDLTDKGQIKIEVSGSSNYYLLFDIDGIQVGSSVSSMIISSSIIDRSEDNPISSSISSSGGTDLSPRLTVTFTGSELRGYHEVDVTGSSTYYLIASSGSFGTPPTGSIPKPFNLDWGVPESTFIDPDYYPSTRGYTWLWNDGYKVKHIKMNNISSTGDILTDFIKHSEWARFVMYNPVNTSHNLIHTGDGFYTEDYQLFNVTKYSSQNYTHLFVDQNNVDTSFAVDVSPQDNITDTFEVTGDYIVYASSSGNTINPVISTGIDKSIPQGFFPSPNTNYPVEQFFRGWAGANYYVNGNLISANGILDDPLQSFFTGSTERDKDGLPNYVPSVLPFFIDASASYQEIQSSSFIEYNFQSNLVRIGPSFTPEAGSGETIYYYKEDTGQIVIRGSQYLNLKKSEAVDYEPLYNTQLVGPNNTTTINYETPEGFTIPILPSQSLWLSRGIAPIGTGNGNLYKYNRYLHRPYKVYIVTSTGSAESGYGNQVYGRDDYGTPGSSPVGPPPNEFGSVYVAYSSSEASARPVDGIYTFNQPLIEPLLVSASVDLSYTSIEPLESSSYGTASYTDVEYQYGGTGSGEDVLTWETATLNLYQNNNIIKSQPVSITHNEIINGITLDLDIELQTYQVSPGDTLRLSLAVSDEPTTFNSSLLATSYTMSFNNLVYPSNDLTPVTFNNYLELNDDCNPLVNNITGDRPNARLQDVDYSVDILTPINLSQILKDEAVRATIPESNYTQLGFTNQRYFGSSTSRRQINEYNGLDVVDSSNKIYYPGDTSNPNTINKGKGPKLGKIPNVELKNGYIAYFNKIIDPYPNLNNKTAYYVKYLIDQTGTIFDPTLSDINFSIFEKTFQLYDYDLKPTRVKTSLQNIEEAKELSQLNQGLSNTFKLGQYPTPILYTQNSSLGHTDNIILSGSPFFGTLGLASTFTNYGININAIQDTSNFPTATNENTNEDLTVGGNITELEFNSSNITPFSENTTPNIPTGSTSNSIIMPLDPAASIPDTLGANLSDSYFIEGDFEFYTSTIPARYRRPGGSARDWHDGDMFSGGEPNYKTPIEVVLEPFQKAATSPTETFSRSIQNFEVLDVTLTPIENPGSSTEVIFKTLSIERYPSGFAQQYTLNSNGLTFTPDSRYLEKIIIQQIFGNESWASNKDNRVEAEKLIGGGWFTNSSGENFGIQGSNVVYRWNIKFKFTNLKQGSGVILKTKGEVKFGSDGGKHDDFFTEYGPNGNDYKNAVWKRTFNPDITATGATFSTQPYIKYTVTSPLANTDQNANGAPGPYWRRVSNTANMLFMSSSILNQTYGIFDENGQSTNGNYYVQAKLDYTPGSNIDFPSTEEPSFTEFDPVVDPWSLQIGDEIRFENNEDLVYTITSAEGRQAIEPPIDPYSTNPETDGLRIIISPPFEYTGSNGNIITKEPTNLDFFVVRRYKENKNFIILDQQKPYGFPVSSSSSPGILLPEHRIEKYDRNPDEVLKDLIEKRII